MIPQTVDIHFQGYNRVPQPAASVSFLLPIDTKTNQPPTRCALSPLQSSPQHSQYNHGGALSPLQSSSLTQPFNFLNTDWHKPTGTNHFLPVLGSTLTSRTHSFDEILCNQHLTFSFSNSPFQHT